MYDRYEHRFTVSAIRTPAGVSWSIDEMDPEQTIWDRVEEEWVDPTPALLEDDQRIQRDLEQRLFIVYKNRSTR